MAYQAAYDIDGANEATVRFAMRSAHEFPMAKTVEVKVRQPSSTQVLTTVLLVNPMMALLKPRM
jgi:hypothetical protein